MRTSLIVAMDRQGTIGFDGGLPWHLPADLKRFRRITWGKPIVMGRKTFESIGRALPGRPNIVLTRSEAPLHDVHVVHTPEEALQLGWNFCQEEDVDELLIVGGAEVYRLFMDQVEYLYLTIVEGTFPGSVFFPMSYFEGSRWRLVNEEHHPAYEKNLAHTYVEIERVLADDSGERTDAHPIEYFLQR